eukprot:COSAG06_NODE_1203_length_10283_cov_11.228397_5_plen_47_part_00
MSIFSFRLGFDKARALASRVQTVRRQSAKTSSLAWVAFHSELRDLA